MRLRLHGRSGVITAAAFQLDLTSFVQRMALLGLTSQLDKATHTEIETALVIGLTAYRQ